MPIAYVKKLKDIDNNTIYPQSITSAVVDKNGVTLDDLHHSFVRTSSVENIEDVDQQYESMSNKVITVNESSTDSQYPSAKAVYEAILANKSEGLSFVIVNELPVENINTGAIYLLSIESAEDSYDEYLYINEKWEKIGTTRVDLTNYFTKDEAGNQFASKSLYKDTAISLGRRTDTGSVGANSVATGDRAQANGNYSVAMGSLAQANAMAAVALGREVRANSSYSIALGEGAITKRQGSVAMGTWNVEDTSGELVHTVGNGTSSSARSNAHTVNANGTSWFQGDVYVGSTSGINKDEGSKKLATEDFVKNRVVSSSVDIGEGAALENGVIYLVYEE
jgi:hypothetical protein